MAKPPVPIPPFVDEQYAALLEHEAAGIPRAELERLAGRSRQTIWRSMGKKEGSLRAAFRIRAAINEHYKEERLPPPVVPVRDSVDYEWFRAGIALRTLNPELFDRAVTQVRALLREEEALAQLKSLSHSTESEGAPSIGGWVGTKRSR